MFIRIKKENFSAELSIMIENAASTARPHLLVIDDDTRIRALLSKYLQEQGFYISTAKDAADARQALQEFSFDLLIMDVMMPGETGLTLAASLRKESRVPILMLSAMGEADDRILGLESGVDDYMVKPFEPRELLLRIHSILRRSATLAAQRAVRIGDWAFDTAKHFLTKGEASIALTQSESNLLQLLASHMNQPLSREKLAELSGGTINERSIDVQITRLRQKLEPDPKKPRHLQTLRGEGYILHG